MDLTVSVCICTRDRPAELRRALESIRSSSARATEVIVSDDGDAFDASIAATEFSDLPLTVKAGPRCGLGANRNSCLAAARAAYVLFLDDDAMLGEKFIETMADHLAGVDPRARSRTILTGIEIKDGHPVFPHEQTFLGFQSRPYREGEPLRTVVINAALFPRKMFESVRFDEHLRYGSDEIDLTTRAVAAGYSILPCFEAANLHQPSELSRGDYAIAAVSSRLYATFKRRRWTDRSPLAAWLGLLAAAAHVYLASIKRSGMVRGGREGHRAVALALSHLRA
jgi:glycosyltransferase involved in cell wall biosynthesis